MADIFDNDTRQPKLYGNNCMMISSSITLPGTLKNIDLDKLNLLLENLEPLLKLVQQKNKTRQY